MQQRLKVVERCVHDPSYQLLHDQVSDTFVKYLKKSDDNIVQKPKLMKEQKKYDDINDDDENKWISEDECDRDIHAALLCESIARKLFSGEAHYADRVRDWLINEVEGEVSPEDDYVVETYLKEVKASGKSKIRADALLPLEIIHYVHDSDVRRVAEIHGRQWWRT